MIWVSFRTVYKRRFGKNSVKKERVGKKNYHILLPQCCKYQIYITFASMLQIITS